MILPEILDQFKDKRIPKVYSPMILRVVGGLPDEQVHVIDS